MKRVGPKSEEDAGVASLQVTFGFCEIQRGACH